MTGLLKDVMGERADVQPAPHVDVHAIMTTGDRRVRRRRAVGGLAALATVAVVAGGALLVPHVSDPTPRVADGGGVGFRGVSWATGQEIHLRGSVVDTGATVRSYVPTDDGLVWTVPSGDVMFGDGTSTPERVGTTSKDGYYLKSDDTGSLVAWIEFPVGAPAELVVYDTASSEVVLRSADGTSDGMGSYRDGVQVAYVYAVDDGAVYWFNNDGVVRTDVATGSSTVLGQSDAFGVNDVANGRLVYTRNGTFVGPTLTTGTRMPHQGNAYLSPEATYVSFEDADQMFVTRTADGSDATPVVTGYGYHAVYGWLDDDTVEVSGIKDVSDGWDKPPVPIDFLTCTVSTGDCTKVGSADVDLRSFALPTGEALD